MTPFRLLAASLLTALTLPALAATITGTVIDRTTGKPAANDTVVLIAFGAGMQEAAHTTTDAQGRYTLDVPEDTSGNPNAGMHLVRVTHQKAAYFQPAPPGTKSLDVNVYDVAAVVKGVSTEADVLRFETDQQGLHVIENYFVRNDSKPAMTQLSNKAFEIYLPEGAQIEATAAMGPGGMPVSSSPIPLQDKGHYAFIFPVRPGETRFQISYHVPYSGSAKWTQKVALPTENLAVMLPKAMTFTPASSDFQPVPDNVAAQTFVLKGVSPSKPVDFTIAGSGAMPRESQNAAGEGGPNSVGVAQGQGAGPNTPEAGSAAAAADTRPGGGLGPPIDTPDPLHKYKAWILGALAVALVAGAAFLLRGKPATTATPPQSATAPLVPAAAPVPPLPTAPARASADGAPLLAALKDALFTLETERLGGKLSEAEYAQLKPALEVVLRWALARSTGQG
jgi:5-hydroxyisourate hydrolase-like protein (transthyretin family)